MKDIKIKKQQIEVVTEIIVDGKEYPITEWNRNVISDFEQTKDEKELEKLKDFTLVF